MPHHGDGLDLSKLFDPTAWLNFAIGGFKAWRGLSVLAFGTTRVGKTTLWRYLESGQPPDTDKIERTMEITGAQAGGDPKFRMHDVKLSYVPVAFRAFDVPGHEELRHTWKTLLYEVKPKAILFMIDHDAGDRPVGGTGVTAARMEEHANAFEHLRDLILDNDEVSGNLRSLVALANKADAWHSDTTYGELMKRARIRQLSSELHGLKRLSTRSSYCSALYGDNLKQQMRTLVGEL